MERVIIAGFGGQGIILAGKLVIQTGLILGRNVTFIPSYGAEVRGGTSHCHIIVSETEIASPIIVRPDACLVMNSPSFSKFIGRVRPRGLFLINSSLVIEEARRVDIKQVRIPASDIAEELGSVKAANMVMLGAYLRYSQLLTLESFRSVLKAFLPARHHDLLKINLQALQRGCEF